MIRLEIKSCNMILTDVDRGTTEISALSLSKTDKYKYLTSEEILPFN